MSVSKQFILSKLPAFRNERVLRAEKQEVLRDIIPVMLNAHRRNGWLYDRIGQYFVGADIDETCKNLYEFCKENLRYDEEPDKMQTVSVPQGLLTAGHCDCKGFASFTNGCLSAISRMPGQRIKWHYCFASYKMLKKTPYHVFSVVDTATGPIWIDPTPGSGGQDPIWWMNRTVKNSDMALHEVVGSVYTASGSRLGSTGMGIPIPALAANQQQLAASVLLQNAGGDPGVTLAPPVVLPVTTIATPAPPPPDNIAPVPGTGFMGVTNKQLLVGIGAVTALYFIAKPGGAVSGIGKKNKNMVPLAIGVAALGYWLYTRSKKNQSGTGNNTGIVKIDGGFLNDAFSRKRNDFTTYYDGIYRDQLLAMLPQYASVINQMSLRETQVLYHLVVDSPAGTVSQTAEPDVYNELIALKQKYNLTFF